jgi:hypothetical protein
MKKKLNLFINKKRKKFNLVKKLKKKTVWGILLLIKTKIYQRIEV